MKQVFMILAAALLSAVTVSAQDYKPAAGSFGLEVGISPFNLGGQNAFDTKATGIYSLSDKLALRVGLGITTVSTSSDNGESNNSQVTNNTYRSNFSIAPGIVYSFAGTQKLTPYIGAELELEVNSVGSKTKRNNITTTVSNSNGSNTVFGFGVFSGFNYYIAQHVYIGAEIQLGGVYRSFPNEKIEYSGSGAPQDPEESKASQSTFAFNIGAYPFLRLGWNF